MSNFLSTIWGVIILVLAIICLIPFLGWGNWIVIPLAVIGIIIGAFSDKRTGMYLNIIALVIALFRLSMGGGII